MKNLLKAVAIFLGAALLLVAIVVMSFMIRGGAFEEVVSISPGACRPIEIQEGSAEDLQIDRKSGTAFLSVLDRRGIVEGQSVKGSILALPLNSQKVKLSNALYSQPQDFRPHGLSIFVADNGTETLIVINHALAGERIEIFEKQESQQLFSHVETITSPLLREPNDLVAVGPRQFYVANDSGATNGLEKAAEMIFGWGMSPLFYFDGSGLGVVDTGLKSSGGINVSPSYTELYVGETVGESIRVYRLERDRSLGEHADTINLQAGVDNIDIALNGDLWIANHTNTLALVQHFVNSDSPAPTQIQRLQILEDSGARITTIYENDGTEFSAGSVGAKYGNEFLIGSITERKLLRCQIND
ncbi:MAG: hypothetical protein P8L66_10255 [Rhodospirillaceae bacterium]|nr:hypothetical protein [Rhodospirillaceae bacterium]